MPSDKPPQKYHYFPLDHSANPVPPFVFPLKASHWSKSESIESSFICSLNKCFLNAYYVSGTVLVTWDTMSNKLLLLLESSYPISHQVTFHPLNLLQICLPSTFPKPWLMLPFFVLGSSLQLPNWSRPSSIPL